jgi:hypothetical protein
MKIVGFGDSFITPKMHRILADTIIAAIEDYKPGLLNIKL